VVDVERVRIVRRPAAVSHDFLESEFIQQTELPNLVEAWI
jgi:hypothetical protein